MHCAPTGWVPRLNAPMLCSQASVHPCSVHTGSAPKLLCTQAQELCTQTSLHPGPSSLHPGLCAPWKKLSAARPLRTQAQALCSHASLQPGLSAARPMCPLPRLHPESLPKLWAPGCALSLCIPRLSALRARHPCSVITKMQRYRRHVQRDIKIRKLRRRPSQVRMATRR